MMLQWAVLGGVVNSLLLILQQFTSLVSESGNKHRRITDDRNGSQSTSFRRTAECRFCQKRKSPVPPRAGRNSRHPLSDGTLLLFGWSTTVIFEALRKAMVTSYTSGETPNDR